VFGHANVSCPHRNYDIPIFDLSTVH
jgi:hypothetical protein